MVSKKREEGSHATRVLGEDLGGRRWFLRINRSGSMLQVLVLVFRKNSELGFEERKRVEIGFGGRRRVERFSKLMWSTKVFWFKNYIGDLGKSLWLEKGECIYCWFLDPLKHNWLNLGN